MTLRHTLIASATAGVALLSLTACGSSGASNSSAAGQPTAAASAGSGTDAQGGAAGDRMPGASGQIAAKQGDTLQVQNDTDGQVAVSYTAKTAITAQVAAALKDVKVGSCVSVTPASTDSASSGDTGTQSAVTAGTVRVTQPVDGACTSGFGGGRGMPGGAPSGMPAGLPSDAAGSGGQDGGMPSGGPSGAPGRTGGFGANGSVTAVNGASFTVKSSMPGDDETSATITVTVDSSTTYTTTKTSSSSALKVGQCVVASGQSDDTGAVAAERLVVSAPVDGSCSSGFGGFGRPSGSDAQDGSSAQGGAA